jgi:hypothetical protein
MERQKICSCCIGEVHVAVSIVTNVGYFAIELQKCVVFTVATRMSLSAMWIADVIFYTVLNTAIYSYLKGVYIKSWQHLNLMFVDPCIIIRSINNQLDAIFSFFLFLLYTLHVSGALCTHHQEYFKNCTCSLVTIVNNFTEVAATCSTAHFTPWQLHKDLCGAGRG